MTFKKLILAASLTLLSPISCHGEDQLQPIGPFGGLNTQDSPEAIDITQSPDLLNVDINKGGKSVKKRQGFGIDVSLSVSTNPVHNLYKFFDASGNEVRLAFNDIKVNSSINGAAWTVILSTGITVGATWDCTDYLGFAYCVSSAFDCPIKTNGTSVGTTGACGTNAVPQGSLISNSGDRLLVGATSANPSRLYYSASAVFSDFSLGSQSSSSSFEDIVAPGSKLTHLAYHYGRWLWWKDQSFGFIVGTGQFDLQIVTVSNTIGTLDNTDVFDNGITFFRGSDSQIYTYDGSNLSRAISTDISPTLRTANKRKANLWVQTSASDFNAGSSTPTFTDTTTVSGSVVLAGSRTTFPTFTGWTVVSGSTLAISNAVQITTSAVGASQTIAEISNSFPQTYHNNVIMYAKYAFQEAVFTQIIEIRLSDSSGNGYYVSVRTPSGTGNISKTITRFTPSAELDLASRNDFGSADISTHTVEMRRASDGSISFYYDGVFALGATDTTYSSFTGGDIKYAPGSTPYSASIWEYDVIATTGAYYSAVNNAPNLSSWNSFTANASLNNGTLSYYTRASTNSFAVLSSTPAWVAQTNGSIVAASTGTYFQLMSSFSITAATQTPTLNDFTFNWFEGSAADKMYGTYFNNAIWFSVSLGTSTTTNNRILRYDLLAGLWTLYDIPANGFLTYNNNLYFGGPSTGVVYQFGQGVTSDNGSAINAYWKSKPFFGDSPFTEKDLRTASYYVGESSGTTLSLTYTLDESTRTIAKTISLYDSRKNFIQNNWNFPTGSTASNFSVQFGDNSTNPSWEMFGGAVVFVPRPWRATP